VVDVLVVLYMFSRGGDFVTKGKELTQKQQGHIVVPRKIAETNQKFTVTNENAERQIQDSQLIRPSELN
jgi:hypothetical protein